MQHPFGIRSISKALLIAAATVTCLMAQSASAATAYTQQMQLSANGQLLTLLLKPSTVTESISVMNNAGTEHQVPVNTFTGKIKGDPDSWVRLTQSYNTLDGVISRFGKRFRLQQSGNDAVEITPLADNHNRHVTITHNPLSNMRFDRNTLQGATKGDVTKVAKIAIVVDSQFNDHHNGNGLAYALGLINAVDGVYREEFGLALEVATAINIVDAKSDPFIHGPIEVETMLRRFRDFRINSPFLDDSVSLVHLFTGNRPSDEPVGLAWIDTACRPDGYDVGLSTPYRHDILLVAHEIAHNLGALHDSDTACHATTDKVMWPYISAGTSQQFSSCTVETVKRKLANSCHAQAIDLELAMSVNDNSTVQATVRNNDTSRANPVATLAFDLPAGARAVTLQGDCEDQELKDDREHIECTIGTLMPGADSVVVLQVETPLPRDLLANVQPTQFIDVIANNSVAMSNSDSKLVLIANDAETPIDRLISTSSKVVELSNGNDFTAGAGAISPLALLAMAILVRRRI